MLVEWLTFGLSLYCAEHCPCPSRSAHGGNTRTYGPHNLERAERVPMTKVVLERQGRLTGGQKTYCEPHPMPWTKNAMSLPQKGRAITRNTFKVRTFRLVDFFYLSLSTRAHITQRSRKNTSSLLRSACMTVGGPETEPAAIKTHEPFVPKAERIVCNQVSSSLITM